MRNGGSNNQVQHVERRVQHELLRRVRSFRLSLRGEGLVLRGRADSYYAKQLAQHAVMSATSIPIASNDIEVA